MAQDDGRVITNFIHQALEGKPITVYGDGSQTRSFCYVDDLIDGLSRLFWTESLHSPINLGNPTPISMLDLASEIISLTGSSSEIIFKELPQDDPQDRRPDITKAMKHLNWEPAISRTDGLKKTLEYVLSQ
jgi:UDP-glucuronate decarboxylase